MGFTGGIKMETKFKMVYWKGDKFWVGKLLEHPEIMSQGETIQESGENLALRLRQERIL